CDWPMSFDVYRQKPFTPVVGCVHVITCGSARLALLAKYGAGTSAEAAGTFSVAATTAAVAASASTEALKRLRLFIASPRCYGSDVAEVSSDVRCKHGHAGQDRTRDRFGAGLADRRGGTMCCGRAL